MTDNSIVQSAVDNDKVLDMLFQAIARAADDPESWDLLLKQVKTLPIELDELMDLFTKPNNFDKTVWDYAVNIPKALEELLLLLDSKSLTSNQFVQFLLSERNEASLISCAVINDESLKILFDRLSFHQKIDVFEHYGTSGLSLIHPATSFPKSFKALISLVPDQAVLQKIESLVIKSSKILQNSEYLSEFISLIIKTNNLELLRVTDRYGRSLWHFAQDFPELKTKLLHFIEESEEWIANNESELTKDCAKLIHVIRNFKTNLEIIEIVPDPDLIDMLDDLLFKSYAFYFQKNQSERSVASFTNDVRTVLRDKNKRKALNSGIKSSGQAIKDIEILLDYSGQNYFLHVKKLECLLGWDDIKQQMRPSFGKRFAQLKACADSDSEEALELWNSIVNDTTMKNGETMLIYAIKKGYKDIVAHLLKRPTEAGFNEKLRKTIDSSRSTEGAQEREIVALLRDKLNSLLVNSISQIEEMEQMKGWSDVSYYLERPEIAIKWNLPLERLKRWKQLPYSKQIQQTQSMYVLYRDMVSNCIRNIGEHEYDDHGPLWEAFYEALRGNLDLLQGFVSVLKIIVPPELCDMPSNMQVKPLLLSYYHPTILQSALLLDGIEELDGWSDLVEAMGGQEWSDKFSALSKWARSSISDKCKNPKKIMTLMNEFFTSISSPTTSALIHAALKGHKEILERLILFRSGYYVTGTDLNKKNALMTAVSAKNHEIIQLLLQTPLRINAQDNTGSTALMMAVANKDYETISLLLEQPNIDLNIVNNDDMTALFLAINNKDYRSLNLIVHAEKANPNFRNKKGMTALMLAIENNDPASIYILLQIPDIDVLGKNSEGLDALMLAIKLNNTAIVSQLLESNKFKRKNQLNYKLNPISLAQEQNNPEMVYLINNYLHCDDESDAVKLLNIVAEISKVVKTTKAKRVTKEVSWDREFANLQADPDDEYAYQALLDKFRSRDSEGSTLCKRLIENYGMAVIDNVLKIPGMDINEQSESGFTLLMEECLNSDDNPDMVRYLLGIPGIDVTLRNYQGCDALMIAMEARNLQIFTELINTPGIDVFVKNKAQLSVLDIAVKKRNQGLYTEEVLSCCKSTQTDEDYNKILMKNFQYIEKYKKMCELIENRMKEQQKENTQALDPIAKVSIVSLGFFHPAAKSAENDFDRLDMTPLCS